MMLLEPFFYIAQIIVDTYTTMVIVQLVLHWLIYFKILKNNTTITKKIMEFLYLITEPVYKRISKKIKPIGAFDISPIVLILALTFASRLLFVLRQMLVS